MLIYKFQSDVLTNEKIIPVKYQANKYFSELLEVPKIKKYLEKAKFKIYVGPKGCGKSYAAFLLEGVRKFLKNGGRGAYMRNSLNEIKAIKTKLAELIKRELGVNVKVSDEGITNEDRTWTYLTFIQTQNYNKISGNLEGYDFLIYDEFNQVLKGNATTIINDDFINILSTIFRDKPVNVIACGNNKTKNNIFYNLFKITPRIPQNPIELISAFDGKVIFLNYTNKAFKEINADEEAYKLFEQIDKKNFDMFYKGEIFEREDTQIINNFASIQNQFKFINIAIIFNNSFYGVFEWKDNNKVWFISKLNEQITLEKINILLMQKCKIYGIEITDYINESKGVKPWDKLADKLTLKLRNYQLFFDNYEIFQEVINNYPEFNNFLKDIKKL